MSIAAVRPSGRQRGLGRGGGRVAVVYDTEAQALLHPDLVPPEARAVGAVA